MSYNTRSKFNFKLIFISILISGILIASAINVNKNIINKKIESIGGTVKSIDARAFNIGPFHYISKGQVVYKVIYKDKDSQEKEAWIRTGLINDWVWDYKED